MFMFISVLILAGTENTC